MTSDQSSYKQLFEMLLDAMPSSVVIIDPDLTVVDANHNFLKKGGFSKGDIIDQPVDSIFPPELIEQTDLSTQIRQVFSRKQPIRDNQISFVAPGVQRRLYLYSLFPFFQDEAVENVILLMVDITEQVRLSNKIEANERYLANLMNCITDVIVSTDHNCSIVSWNHAAELLTGKSFQNAIGKGFFSLFNSGDEATHQSALHGLSNDSTESNQFETKLQSKAGEWIDISWNVSAVKKIDSDQNGFVFIGRDSTKAKKLEQQLQQSKKLASLGMMAGAIAHQIRNPLSSCSSAAQFIEDPNIDSNFRNECIQEIGENSKKISRIIESMLNLAPHQKDFDKTAFNINKLIRETATETVELFNNEKIEFVDSITDSPTYVIGNRQLIKQTVVNIIQNSLESMPDGGTLLVETIRKRKEYIALFCDTGYGIRDENRKHVFDPFFSRQEKNDSLGLGLTICHAIIDMHAGKIEFVTKAGFNTTVQLSLPVMEN